MADVSIIIPVYNAGEWLAECLHSVLNQRFDGKLQLSVYNDGSTDDSLSIIEEWRDQLEKREIDVVIGGHSEAPKGVGYAKNKAVEQSNGKFLCFLDADDAMHGDRIREQYKVGVQHPLALIGCQFWREPEGSTVRFTNWANSLTAQQLYTQVYTSHGPTVVMPTWFCSRAVYEQVGKFDESGKGTPEDLLFFNKHLQLGGEVIRVNQVLLMYRYHPGATTFSISEETIWQIRMNAIQERVIASWDSFTIWNAGKQGRHFYRSLTDENRRKVRAFCDVDVKKIAKGVYTYQESKEIPKPEIPVIHFTEASPPFIICVKQELTGGGFEENLASLNLTEGVDFFHFN